MLVDIFSEQLSDGSIGYSVAISNSRGLVTMACADEQAAQNLKNLINNGVVDVGIKAPPTAAKGTNAENCVAKLAASPDGVHNLITFIAAAMKLGDYVHEYDLKHIHEPYSKSGQRGERVHGLCNQQGCVYCDFERVRQILSKTLSAMRQ